MTAGLPVRWNCRRPAGCGATGCAPTARCCSRGSTALRDGIEVDGIRYGAIEATLDREQGANSWITFAMREGKNREIRNVLGALGLKVNRLIRLSYGPFQLGELPAGAVEEVKTRALREQLGERLAAMAGADFSGPIVEREIEPEPQAKLSPRHPEVRGAQRRASKGDGPDRSERQSSSQGTLHLPGKENRGRSSFEGRLRRPPQDDGERKKFGGKHRGHGERHEHTGHPKHTKHPEHAKPRERTEHRGQRGRPYRSPDRSPNRNPRRPR